MVPLRPFRASKEGLLRKILLNLNLQIFNRRWDLNLEIKTENNLIGNQSLRIQIEVINVINIVGTRVKNGDYPVETIHVQGISSAGEPGLGTCFTERCYCMYITH